MNGKMKGDAPSTDREDRIAQPHTPGPWTFQHGHTNRLIMGGDGVPVAEAHHWVGEHYAEGEANARLIAAAPELLEALESICLVSPGDMDLDSKETAVNRLNAVRQIARAAIAKATGADQ